MRIANMKALACMGALALAASAAAGCAAERPSRNGVFNENQYVRKDFLIQAGDGSNKDTGWMIRSTVVQASSPNPLGGFLDLTPGIGGPTVPGRTLKGSHVMGPVHSESP